MNSRIIQRKLSRRNFAYAASALLGAGRSSYSSTHEYPDNTVGTMLNVVFPNMSIAQIQAVLDRVGAGEVRFASGIYTLANLKPPAGQTLTGQGYVLLKTDIAAIRPTINVGSHANVTVQGFTFDGRASSISDSTSSSGSPGTFPSANSRIRYAGIYALAASGLKVRNCQFTNMWSCCVYAWGGNTGVAGGSAITVGDIEISDCAVDSTCRLDLAWIAHYDDVKIYGNKVSSNTNSFGKISLAANGVVTHSCSHVKQFFNVMDSCMGSGIKAECAAGLHQIGFNQFIRCGYQGFNAQEGSAGDSAYPANLERYELFHNHFVGGSNGNGMLYGVSSGGYPAGNITVESNIFEATPDTTPSYCIAGSGSNWTIVRNEFIGTSGNTSLKAIAIILTATPVTGYVENFQVLDNTNINITNLSTFVQMGYASADPCSLRKVRVKRNTIEYYSFRGIWQQNSLNIDDVEIDDNEFPLQSINEGAWDISCSNTANASLWKIRRNSFKNGLSFNNGHPSSWLVYKENTFRDKTKSIRQQNIDSSVRFGRITDDGGIRSEGPVTLAYSPLMAPDIRQGDRHVITATNSAPFMVEPPAVANLVGAKGTRLTITLRNTSNGTLGAATWNAVYKMAAWTNPIAGHSRSITFEYDGAHYIEISRTPADVPN